MGTTPIIARLWDYGWLSHDRVTLPKAASDAELIEQYVVSPAFHTSFLPSDIDETSLHGPFRAERITKADFVRLREDELGPYLETVELSDTPGADAAERAKALAYIQMAFDGGRMGYVLTRDERDRELFHVWGYTFSVFREFLFIGPQRNSIERFVMAYD